MMKVDELHQLLRFFQLQSMLKALQCGRLCFGDRISLE